MLDWTFRCFHPIARPAEVPFVSASFLLLVVDARVGKLKREARLVEGGGGEPTLHAYGGYHEGLAWEAWAL